MQLAGGANGRRKIISTFVAVGCLLVVSVAVAYIVGLRANVVRTITFIATAVVNLAFLGWACGRLSRMMGQREREKELLATTLASIGDGVIVTNAEARVMLLNAEAERIT